jgi:hypothetical protein
MATKDDTLKHGIFFFFQALRGVDLKEHHSRTWLEETRLKQEESVAILTEHLKGMLSGAVDFDEQEITAALEQNGKARANNKLKPSLGKENIPTGHRERVGSTDSSVLALQRVAVNGKKIEATRETWLVDYHQQNGWREEEVEEDEGEEEAVTEGEGRDGESIGRMCMKTMSCEVCIFFY